MTSWGHGSLVANGTLGHASTPRATRSRWRNHVAERFKQAFKNAVPKGQGVEYTAFQIRCRTNRRIDLQRFVKTRANGDGRPYLQIISPCGIESNGVVLIDFIDFLAIAVSNGHIDMQEATNIYHYNLKIQAARKELADKPPLAERRAKKVAMYYECISDYLCALPQKPKYKRIRTAKEVARSCKLELKLVQKTLKQLVADGKVIRDNCGYGDGYAAAWKDT